MSTQSVPNQPGTDANAPWNIPGRAWWKILKRVYVMSGFHELGLLAGGLAFYCFLALTPLIGATVMIYGLIGNVESVHSQMQSIVEVVQPKSRGCWNSNCSRSSPPVAALPVSRC